MIGTNTEYFVTGGTLSNLAASYIVRQADNDLYDNLIRGEFCYVLNARQMGKSSLMVRTAARLKAEGIAVSVLDLTAVGQNLNPEQWYDGLLARLGRDINLEEELEEFYLSHNRLGPLQRWQEALEQVVLPHFTRKNGCLSSRQVGEDTLSLATAAVSLVIFVDEIDVVRSLPFSADEFFSAIRQCYAGRAINPEWNRIAFCLLGTATPAELVQDTRTSPFNIGRRIELRDFTPEESQPLAAGLMNRGQDLVERAMYWTNGHPYLTQRLCRALAETNYSATAPRITPDVVDRICSDLFLTHRGSETDDNLTFVRNRLLKNEVEIGSLLELFREIREGKSVPDDEADPLAVVLKFSGVAKSENGLLRIRNRIYAAVFDGEWVRANTPDAALQRLRSEYRRTIIKAITLFVGILLLPMLTVGMVHLARTIEQRTAGTICINIITALIVFYAFATLFRPGSVSIRRLISLSLLMLFVVAPFTLAVSPIDPYIRLNAEFYFSFRWTIPLLIFLLKDAFLNLIFLPFYWVWQKRWSADYPPLTHAFLFATGSVLLVYSGVSFIESGVFASVPVSELGYYKVGYVTLYTALTGIAICLGWGVMGYAVGIGIQQKKIPWMLLLSALVIRMILDFSFTHATTLFSVLFSLISFGVCAHYLLKETR